MARPRRARPACTHTAIVTQECQEAVVGANAGLAALAEEAQREAVPNIARLLPVARAAGVSVIHCVVTRRADGRGSNHNAALSAYGAKTLSAEPGSHGAAVVPELGPEPSDLVLTPTARPRPDVRYRPRLGPAEPGRDNDRPSRCFAERGDPQLHHGRGQQVLRRRTPERRRRRHPHRLRPSHPQEHPLAPEHRRHHRRTHRDLGAEPGKSIARNSLGPR